MSMYAPRAADYSLLLLKGLVIASSYVFIKYALLDFDPMFTIMSRLWLAAFVLLIVSLCLGDSFALKPRDLANLFLVGATGQALPFFLVARAEVHVEPGLISIFIGLMPIMTLVLAHFFTEDEKLNRYKVIGVLLAFSGLLVLIIPSLTSGLSEDLIPELLVVGAAFAFAVNSVLTKRVLTLPRRVAATGLCFMAALSMTFVWSLTGKPVNWSYDFDPIAAIIALAVISSVLSVLLTFEILARQGASFLGQVYFVVPAMSIFLAYFVLSVKPSIPELVALVIILVGFAISRKQVPVKQIA